MRRAGRSDDGVNSNDLNPNKPKKAKFNNRNVEQAPRSVSYLLETIFPSESFKSIFDYCGATCVPSLSCVNRRFNSEAYSYLRETFFANRNPRDLKKPCNVNEPFNREILPITRNPDCFRTRFLYAVKHWKEDVVCKEYLKAILLCIECRINRTHRFQINELLKRTDDNILNYFLSKFIKIDSKQQQPKEIEEFLKSEELKKEFELYCSFDNDDSELWNITYLWMKKSIGYCDIKNSSEDSEKCIFKFTICYCKDLNEDLISKLKSKGDLGLTVENNRLVMELNENDDKAVHTISRFIERYLLNYHWEDISDVIDEFLDFFARHPNRFSNIIFKVIFFIFNNYIHNKDPDEYIGITEILMEFTERNLINKTQASCFKDFMFLKNPSDGVSSLYHWRKNLTILVLFKEFLINNWIDINEGDEAVLCKEIIIESLKDFKEISKIEIRGVNINILGCIQVILSKLIEKKLIETKQEDEYLIKNSLFEIIEDNEYHYHHLVAMDLMAVLLTSKLIIPNIHEADFLKNYAMNTFRTNLQSNQEQFLHCLSIRIITALIENDFKLEGTEIIFLKDYAIKILCGFQLIEILRTYAGHLLGLLFSNAQ